MPGPYFSKFYTYAQGMTRTEYLVIGLWIILLIIIVFLLYSLKKSLDSVLSEAKEISATAQQLKEQSKNIDEMLQEV
ncbi:hypothetical protein [Thermococcus barophilus]|uniref:Uncharacterized protein n=1 Tax=Thermococcus barophilus TaxID=55802 RepID=A0A0S1XAV8_THEBA|nr:hypothetical protein [Thermococcus barophilus]ALM74913.1 hypothetical protein TBCH5v1_0967 [Thermococcus barophilus]